MDGRVFAWVLLTAGTFGSPARERTPKLTFAPWDSYFFQDPNGPGTYAFGYNVDDPSSGSVQFRQEEKHADGRVTGSYGYVDTEGIPVTVTYISDEKGYRVKIQKPGNLPEFFPDERSFLSSPR